VTNDDVVAALFRVLCDHQRAKGTGADMSLAELRLALGVTEAQLMEAVRVARISDDLFITLTATEIAQQIVRRMLTERLTVERTPEGIRLSGMATFGPAGGQYRAARRDGAPAVTPPPGTQFRKLLLYPPELRGHQGLRGGRGRF